MTENKKIIGLDILRGLACLIVWLSHIRVVTKYFNSDSYNFIQTFVSWGREAVVVFFILSGIVINLASQNNTDKKQYFKKRFLRIYPIFFVMLVICYSFDYLIFHHSSNIKEIVGNIFLQGMWPTYVVPPIPYDLAAWSIACEAFFYVVFGLFYNYNRPRVIWVWFALSIVSNIFHLFHEDGTGYFYQCTSLLNNSFLWLLGYLIFEYRSKLSTSAQTACTGLLMIPLLTRMNALPNSLRQACYYIAGIYLIPLFVWQLKKINRSMAAEDQFNIKHIYFLPIYLINVWLLWHYSDSLFISKILYSSIPFLSLALYSHSIRNSLKLIFSKIKMPLLFISSISYPLYLVHMPTMTLVYHFLPDQKLIGMLLIIIIAISISYLFEVFLFRKLSAWVSKRDHQPKIIQETTV